MKLLFNEFEVEEIYGLKVATLRGWRFRGLGPRFLKLGRSVRYRAADIEAWITRGERMSTSDPGPAGEER